MKKADIGAISDEEKLDLYKFYKQALEGDIIGDRPGVIQFKSRKKWDAWNSAKGVSKEEAQLAYIELAKMYVPSDVLA
jgi:diazepam-binding inhibitor (GABA receptor modulator, acyl-CoA-binding protein)